VLKAFSSEPPAATAALTNAPNERNCASENEADSAPKNEVNDIRTEWNVGVSS